MLDGIASQLAVAGIIGIATTLVFILRKVDQLATILKGFGKTLDRIEANYVSKEDHKELKDAFWKLHDQHIKCLACRGDGR